MKIEKFEDWYTDQDHYRDERYLMEDAWNHQQEKIYNLLEYISHVGHQKELDKFLKDEYGRE